MHSRSHILRRAKVLDLEALAAPDLGMATSCLRGQLVHRARPCVHDFRSHPHQFGVPHVELVGRGLARRDPLQKAVALLEDPAQPGECSRIARLDLDEQLVEEAPALVRTRLDEAKVVRPEQRDPEMPRQIDGPAPGTIDLDRAPHALAFDVEGDDQLHAPA